MRDNLSSLITQQFSEHVRDSSPLLVSFLEAYYEFMQQRSGAVGLVNYSPDNKDIDRTLNEFIINFYNSYAPLIPRDTAYNKRDLIKRIKDLYESKGTSKSVALLFRLLYNKDISIMYPQEQMLRASGSKWVQESSIRILVNSPEDEVLISRRTFTWENSMGQFSIVGNRVEKLDRSVYEVFFNASTSIKLLPGDIVRARDEFGAVLFSGIAQTVNTRISVIKPGKNFKKGQIFRIPGSIKDTLFRVIDVGRNGELVQSQILSYGYENPESETIDIAPYSSVPIESEITIETEGSLTEIDIFDSSVGFSDSGSIFRVFGFGTPESYFAQEYLEEGNLYTGSLERTFTNEAITQGRVLPPANVDLAEYLASIATIRTSSDTVSVYPGFYESNHGNISDSDIKLQDSYYYQIFSYVINSEISLSQYKNTLLSLLHPAGQIVFSNLQLDTNIDLTDQIGVFLNLITRITIEDSFGLDDELIKNTGKVINDLQNINDSVFKSFLRTEDDATIIQDATASTFFLNKQDSVEIQEDIAKNTFLNVNDVQNITDIISSPTTYADPTYFAENYVGEPDRDDVNKEIIKTESESVPMMDSVAKSYNSVTNDSVIIEEDVNAAGNIAFTVNNSVPIEDSQTSSSSKVLSDSFTPSDTETKSLSRSVDDSFAIEDSAASSVAKTINDLVSITDDMTMSISKTLEDMAVVTDQIPDYYVDPTYFAEEYLTYDMTDDFSIVSS